MRRDDWLRLDTETTDLADAGGGLVEIEIVPEVQAVHGLTLDQLVAAPTFAELEPQLRGCSMGGPS